MQAYEVIHEILRRRPVVHTMYCLQMSSNRLKTFNIATSISI
jgi:hypothetical protein